MIKLKLTKDRVANKIDRVSDGVEAMQYLRGEGGFANAARPDLVLLDLNMPRMDGREVLKQCDEDPDLKSIPIVVFTSSDDERDVLESYKYKANSYVTKPIDLVKFREVLQNLSEYWFCIVTLPPSNGCL